VPVYVLTEIDTGGRRRLLQCPTRRGTNLRTGLDRSYGGWHQGTDRGRRRLPWKCPILAWTSLL